MALVGRRSIGGWAGSHPAVRQGWRTVPTDPIRSGHAPGRLTRSGGCGYDSLNIALSQDPTDVSCGSDVVPGTVYQNAAYGNDYCDGGTAGINTFRLDSLTGPSCWGVNSPYNSSPYYVPAVQFNAHEPTLTVTVKGSDAYGTTPHLTGLAPNNPDISYTPSSEGPNVTGSLSCSTSATATSPAGSYPISNCSGLSDSSYNIVYDYTDSSFTVNLAGSNLTYLGPTE